jgi:hypothetical protein
MHRVAVFRAWQMRSDELSAAANRSGVQTVRKQSVWEVVDIRNIIKQLRAERDAVNVTMQVEELDGSNRA